ncbi:hypothetical protein [Daejeonella sp.]|uniref:carboxypeptidase-like regulatory domain-containing protein n=1 Tax=Daejeonella sp. TaxID=2805397 RepID=UPI0030C008DA
MIGTSAVLQEEYSEHYTIPQTRFFREEKKEEVLGLADLELSVIDSETGKPISKAMISIDALGRTAVCDAAGKVMLTKVFSGNFVLDVIVPGYIANSTTIQLSARQHAKLTINMVSNC